MKQTPSLNSPRLKLAWATRHLQTLEAEIAAASDFTAGMYFEQEFDPNTSTIEVTLRGVPDLPAHWGLLAADYLQNVRSALNYLVWELSRWKLHNEGVQRAPDAKTQFPINTTPGDFSEWRLPDLHPEHIALIRELQPSAIQIEIPPTYRDIPLDELPPSFFSERDQQIAAHPLTHLVTLTNEDKHRTLQVALLGHWQVNLTGTFSGRNCVLSDIAWGRGMPHLENGAVWGTAKAVPTGQGKPAVEIDDKVTQAEVTVGTCHWRALGSISGWVASLLDLFTPVLDS